MAQCAVHSAAKAGSLSEVSRLLEQGEDPEAKDEVFLFASHDPHDLIKEENTPLHYACYKNNQEIASLLLSQGADIHTRGKVSHLSSLQRSPRELSSLGSLRFMWLASTATRHLSPFSWRKGLTSPSEPM
jgi:ankyrin repeat protein